MTTTRTQRLFEITIGAIALTMAVSVASLSRPEAAALAAAPSDAPPTAAMHVEPGECPEGTVRAMRTRDCWGTSYYATAAQYAAFRGLAKDRIVVLVDCDQAGCDLGQYRQWYRVECNGVVGPWFYLAGWTCIDPDDLTPTIDQPWTLATPCPDDDDLAFERTCKCIDERGPCPPTAPGG